MSERANILLKVLQFIDAEDFEDCGDYMIFGQAAFERLGQSRQEDSPDEFNAQALANATMQDMGRKEAASRVAMPSPPLDNLKRYVAKLPAEKAERLAALLQQQIVAQKTGNTEQSTKSDFLDSHYAREVLDRLRRVVWRARLLEPISERIGHAKIPDRVRLCINEAHACYLYDFEIGAAVLCRAILEEILKDAVKALPLKESQRSGKRKWGPPLRDLIETRWPSRTGPNAREPEAKVAAGAVKELGDAAAHSPAEFLQKSDDTRHSLTEIRIILEEFFPASTDAHCT
jgi:hypothetical protein